MPADAISQIIVQWGYWVLIPLAFLEGPLVSLNAGILASLGYFNVFIVFAILLLRDLVVDGFLYSVGFLGSRNDLIKRYSAKIGVTEEHWGIIDRLWERYPSRTMFLSKLAYGISAPFIVSAGMTKMHYRRFWFYAIQVSVVQYGALVALGYFFGNFYSLIAEGVRGVEFIALGAVVLSIGLIFFSRSMRRKLLAEEKREEKEHSPS